MKYFDRRLSMNLELCSKYLRSNRTRSLVIFILALLTFAIASRFIFASVASNPGHADPSFYYDVAQNLVEGRGFQIDYIWNYLNRPDSITHSSLDYWTPLTSVVIALSMLAFGKSLFAALLPSILFGIALSIPCYYFAIDYTGSKFVAISSAALILFVPRLFECSLLCDSITIYAFFASTSLLAMMKGSSKPHMYLISSACAALAHLTRQDGILLLVTLVIVVFASRLGRREKVTYACLALGIYFLVIGPLLVEYWRAFHQLIPPGKSKILFLRDQEDLFTYSKQLTLDSYLKWGYGNSMRSKISMAVLNLIALVGILGSLLWVFIVAAAAVDLVYLPIKWWDWNLHLPYLLYGGMLFTLYSFGMPYIGGGAFWKSSLALTPFLLVLGTMAVMRFIPSKRIALLVLFVIGILFVGQSLLDTRTRISMNAQMGAQLISLKNTIVTEIQSANLRDEAIIMTRNPWEVFHTTKYRCVQIPNDSLDIVFEVAKRYKANFLLLPAPRQALEGIYDGTTVDSRFQFLAAINGPQGGSSLKLFRICHDEN